MFVDRGEVREFGLTGLTRNQVSLTAPGRGDSCLTVRREPFARLRLNCLNFTLIYFLESFCRRFVSERPTIQNAVVASVDRRYPDAGFWSKRRKEKLLLIR